VLGAIPGIGLAIVLAVIEFLWDGWRPDSAVLGRVKGINGYHDISRHPDARLIPGLVLFRWAAPLFFANAEWFHERALDAVAASPTPVRWLVITAEPVTSVDVTAADIVAKLDETLQAAGIELCFAEMKDPVQDKLKRFGLFSRLGAEVFFPTIGEAVNTYLRPIPRLRSTANLGFEAKLWLTADKLRNNMDAAEYKHVVLGLIFLKYISDTFEETARQAPRPARATTPAPTPKTPTSTRPRTSSGCPPRPAGRTSRPAPSSPPSASSWTTPWSPSSATTRASRACCPRTTPAPASTSSASASSSTSSPPSNSAASRQRGEKTHRSVDLLGRVYEYFLTRFASAEGKNGGQFYTPSCVVRCWSRCSPPTRAASTTPAAAPAACSCSRRNSSRRTAASSATSASTARRATHHLAPRHHEPRHPRHRGRLRPRARRHLPPRPPPRPARRLRLANPPFNDSDWFRKDDDVRWQYGVPPKGNANFAWVQHFIHHLAPAACRLRAGQRQHVLQPVRRRRDPPRIIEADLVDCMVALPGQLFYSTQIPVCLWFLALLNRPSWRKPSSPI
jgi:anti-anti-sigma regulatory factor